MIISYREWIRWLCFAVKFLRCCHHATAADSESIVGISIRYAKGNLNDKKECVSKDFFLYRLHREYMGMRGNGISLGMQLQISRVWFKVKHEKTY